MTAIHVIAEAGFALAGLGSLAVIIGQVWTSRAAIRRALMGGE